VIVASFGELCQSDIIVRNIIVPPAGSQHETHEINKKKKICNLINEVYLGWGYVRDEQVLGLDLHGLGTACSLISSALNAHNLELFPTNDAVKETVCAAAGVHTYAYTYVGGYAMRMR
jgi:hypothetical protein